MDKLSVPLQDVDVGIIYETCVNSYRDEKKKKRLFGYKEEIEEEAKKYKGSVSEILKNCKTSYDEHRKEIASVYTDKFAKSSFIKGYMYYSSIKNNVYKNRCPICEIGMPETLDHYLPKEKYPLLSITPANLVPQCFHCNHSKHSYAGDTLEKMLPHPYFDDLSKEVWLKATLLFDEGIVATYSNGYKGTDMLFTSRTSLLLAEYQLCELYGIHAASYLSGHIGSWKMILAEAGEPQLKAHLEREKKNTEISNVNGWEAALNRALNVQFSELVSFLEAK